MTNGPLLDKRRRKAPESQQSRVLEILWYIKGGNFQISRELDLTNSVLNSWKRISGKVPLVHVGRVSRRLKVSPYLLNYREVKDFFGKAPKWSKLVRGCKIFTPDHLDYIFKGKPPEFYESD